MKVISARSVNVIQNRCITSSFTNDYSKLFWRQFESYLYCLTNSSIERSLQDAVIGVIALNAVYKTIY